MTKGINKKCSCFGQLDSIDWKIIIHFQQKTVKVIKGDQIIHLSEKLNLVYCLVW